MERAILQEVISSRDGMSTRPYERPAEVREMASRIQGWAQGKPEACSNCLAARAVTIRQGLAFCAVCREQRATRLELSTRGVTLPFRAAPDPASMGIVGHVIVFNSESVDLGGFIEIVRPSAVDRALSQGQDVRALWSHDSSEPLGRTGPRTLWLQKDATGLYAEIAPPRAAEHRLESVERGDVSGASFGFTVLDDEWHFTEQMVLREIFDLNLYEVSPVAFPAYPATKIRVERLAKRRERESLDRLRMAR